MPTVVCSQKIPTNIPSLFLTSITHRPEGGKIQGVTYAINLFQVCFSSLEYNFDTVRGVIAMQFSMETGSTMTSQCLMETIGGVSGQFDDVIS